MDHIKNTFSNIADQGENDIMLGQSESLIRKDIFVILDIAALYKLKVSITTNGSMLSYYAFLEKLAAKKITHINLSMHSHIPKLANLISRNKNCHSLQKKALQNIDLFNSRQDRNKKRIILAVNLVVCKLNYRYLYDHVLYLKKMLKNTAFRVNFRNMFINDPLDTSVTRLAVTLKKIQPHLLAAAKLLKPQRVNFSAFPLCILPFFEWANVELRETLRQDCTYLNPFTSKHGLSFDTVAKMEFTKYPDCRECSLSNICVGVHKSYISFFPIFDLELSLKDPKKIISCYRKIYGNIRQSG